MSNSGRRSPPVQLPLRHPVDRPASETQSSPVLWLLRYQRLLSIAMRTAALIVVVDLHQIRGAASLSVTGTGLLAWGATGPWCLSVATSRGGKEPCPGRCVELASKRSAAGRSSQGEDSKSPSLHLHLDSLRERVSSGAYTAYSAHFSTNWFVL